MPDLQRYTFFKLGNSLMRAFFSIILYAEMRLCHFIIIEKPHFQREYGGDQKSEIAFFVIVNQICRITYNYASSPEGLNIHRNDK